MPKRFGKTARLAPRYRVGLDFFRRAAYHNNRTFQQGVQTMTQFASRYYFCFYFFFTQK